MSELVAFCEKHGIPCDTDKFDQYVDLLLHFNKAMNLIGPMSKKEVFSSLIVDSLYPAVARAPDGHILDVGSGAGLPGMVLKIAYPELPVTFVEPRKKRANFLRIASNRLGLETTIKECRIEELGEARFEYVISKAFRPPEVWVDIAQDWVTEDGVIVVMHSLPQEFEHEAIAYLEVPGADRAVSVFGQETEKPG